MKIKPTRGAKTMSNTHHFLHTDLYQINMAKAYYDEGVHRRRAVFDLYFRSMPFDNGYAIFVGLERVLQYLQEWQLTDEDVAYLKSLNYDDDFLNVLKSLRFSGDVYSMLEGEVCFNNEPLIRVEGPLIEVQLVETALLNFVNYQTLIATKASRIKQVTTDKQQLMEFGTRRAHEMDAAQWGARASVIAGFNGTSNVEAAKRFDLVPVGTHAHSFVQAYNDEYEAFKAYARSHKECVFLVDTFHTLKSGVPTAIKVANELKDSINFNGIRLDSGDIAYLSKESRKLLDEAGYTDTKIIVSNDLDEYTIQDLMHQGAKVDSWGIGTKLITGYDDPALGAVYKLTAIENEEGQLEDRIKLSNNAIKVSTPGRKDVYRIINNVTGKSEGDYITLADEEPEEEQMIHLFHPVHTFKQKFIHDFTARPLLQLVMESGQRRYAKESIETIQERVNQSLEELWDEYKRPSNPEEYPVDLSEACWENKNQIIKNVGKYVKQVVNKK